MPKPFVFVLMPFSADFNDTYVLGIKPACEEAGYYCERLDEQIFEERMLDRIYNQIAKADLIVADLSERNPNVFYETGYAHALNKRVILLTRNSKDIPFDLQHHFHIVYSGSIAELKTKLRQRAAYYAVHPSESAHNPFEQFDVYLNNVLVRPNADPIRIDAPLFYNNGWKTFLDATFHQRDVATESELVAEVRLITSNEFRQSAPEIPPEGTEYVSIMLPDKRILHKPNKSARVALGDPDKICFFLFADELNAPADFPITLRMFSSGLKLEIDSILHVTR